ncbi:MAG: hypothetical protein KF720_22435 [Rubrivivax sp.]|nr:hypothetical protein [Rubrivivax sp.]
MNTLADTLGQRSNRGVEGMIRSTQGAAHQAVDHLADGAEHLATHADRLAQRSAAALRDHTEHLRERARHAADNTIVHIRQEPLKSVLIAGAIGAAIGALFTLLGRSRH